MLSRLLPARLRTLSESLRQDARDLRTAWRRPLRPPSSRPRSAPAIARAPARPAPSSGQPAPAPPAAHPLADRTAPAVVVFKRSGVELELDDDQTILEAGRAAGLALDFSCTVGGCAACAVQLLEGRVDYDMPHCLTDDEVASGLILACIGRPCGRIVVDA